MNTTPDSSLQRAKHPDMALGSGPCLEVSMVPGGSTSYPNQHDPKCGTLLSDMVRGG